MSTAAPGATSAWLRNEHFDYGYVVGITLVAVAAGLVAGFVPGAMEIVLIGEIALVGWQHVATSFTRLAHHPDARARTFLLALLPPLVVGSVSLGIGLFGTSLIGAIYFYWQTFHYARQLWGIDRIYARKAGQLAPDRLSEALIYAVAAAAMAHRSLVGSVSFGGEVIHFLPTPTWLALSLDATALALGLCWMARAVQSPAIARLQPIRVAFLATYVLVFVLGYGVIGDFLAGWVLVNVWHNLQYVILVRVLHEERFSKPREDTANLSTSLLARFSKPSMRLAYFTGMTLIGFMLMVALQSLSRLSLATLFPLTFAASMSFNFHHYIVDAVIWRSPKTPRA